MCYGIGVQPAWENIFRDLVRGLLSAYFCIGCILFKYRCSGEAEELGVRKELFDCLVIVSELGTVTFIENKYNPFIL